MTRRPRQNFSGLQAVIFHGADRDRRVLTDTLARLGLVVAAIEPADDAGAARRGLEAADIFFFDADLADVPRLPGTGLPRVPVIATIGLETPGRLLRAFDLYPSAVLHKPLRSSGIYSALFFAFNGHRRMSELADRLSVMEARHGARRFVQKAVLQLMEENGCDDEVAYRLLRKESMRQRVTVEELAVRLLADEPHRVRGNA